MNKRIDNLRAEILEDIFLCGCDRKAIIYCYKKFDKCFFEDYELLETKPLTREDFEGNNLRSEKDEKDYQAYLKELETEKLIEGTYNIIYDGESYEIVELKEILYIVSELLDESLEADALALNVNLMIKNITPYKMAQELNISKQAIFRFAKGDRKIPEARKEEIAKYLGFGIEEFKRKRSKYLLLEN